MSNKHIYDNIMQINNMILNINYKSNINVEEKWIKMNFSFSSMIYTYRKNIHLNWNKSENENKNIKYTYYVHSRISQ